MTHEELVTCVAIAMRTKREAILERPLSRCWEDLARVAVDVALDGAADVADEYADKNSDERKHAGRLVAQAIRTLKGEPA